MSLDTTQKIRFDNDLAEALQNIADESYEGNFSRAVRAILRSECENRGLLTVKLSKKVTNKQQLVAGGDITIENNNGSIRLGDNNKSGH